MTKRLINLYLFTNIHVALGAVALTLTTQAMLGLSLRRELLIFVFCGTFFGYNLQRLPFAFAKHRVLPGFTRHYWVIHHRVLLTNLSLVAGTMFVWSFTTLYLRSQTVALIPAALSFAYALPVIPARRQWIELRDIPGIKIFIIAVTWSCSCALLPIASVHLSGASWFPPAALLWAMVCAVLIFALTVPFDIRDLHYDGSDLKTLPAVLGVKNSIRIATAGLIASAAIPWMICSRSHALGYSVWSVIAACFIYKSSPERHEYYFSFWMDGLILLLWVIVTWLP